jgi:hypothetical protein
MKLSKAIFRQAIRHASNTLTAITCPSNQADSLAFENGFVKAVKGEEVTLIPLSNVVSISPIKEEVEPKGKAVK